MLMNTVKQAKIFKRQKLIDEQIDLAKYGISSAIENDYVVTIGDADCDYLSFKHFLVGQMAIMGMKQFANKTEWPLDDLIEFVTNEGPDNSEWFETAENYFDAMQGDY